MGKRVDLVDVAKGISILLVAFNHSQLSSLFQDANNAMGLFRMPLFFFLSGVFFSTVRSPRDFFIHKTDALLKPYFATLIFLLLTTILIGREGVLREALGIFYGTGFTIRWRPMWFLTHLWLVFMACYILVRRFRLDGTSVVFRFSLVVGFILLGVITMNLFRGAAPTLFDETPSWVGMPLSVDFMFISMAFFLSGHFLHRQVKAFTPQFSLLLLMGCIYFLVVFFSEARIDLNTRVYQEPVLATLAAVSGIYLVISGAYYLSRYPGAKAFFKTFGSASLFILIFHYFLGRKMQWLLDQFLSPDWLLLTAAVSFVFSVTLPLLSKIIISKNRFLSYFYFPFKQPAREAGQAAEPVPYNKIP
ncbi:MAG: acyltransferase family protein [Candidatus Thiodiazotropha sp. (ex Ctena orbiculata)]|nr:acyltransferase family protein [Candidatus Thiodiazotropha taylori]